MRRTLLFLLMSVPLLALAQTPQKFNYQAIVRNNNGTIVSNQNVSIRFSIHDGTANGTVQYSETQSITTNAYGLINLQVGTGTVVSGSFAGITWNNGNKFLQVEADISGGSSYTTLATVELVAVPYALQSGGFSGSLAGDVSGTQSSVVIEPNAVTSGKIADAAVTTAKIADNAVTTAKIATNAVTDAQLADGAATNAKIADNAVTTAKIAANAVTNTQLADGAVTNAKIADNAVTTAKIAANAVTNGQLADGAVTNAKIADSAITAGKIISGEVVKSVNGLKDNVVINGTGGTSVSVSGDTISIAGTPGTITGVTAGAGLTGGGNSGNVTLSANFGGDGSANSLSRSNHTHIGQTWSTNSGRVLTLTDYDTLARTLDVYSYGRDYNAAAVRGIIPASTGQSVGVFGSTASSNGQAAAVFGQATADGGAKGVWGIGYGANTFGVFGQAAGAGSWAGYFQGNVHVNGTLSKAAGSFMIDDPIDPANKYLYHSFVESPDMMNVYNGNVTLDANGEATITMPDWFEALNKDFRYQLTAMGKPSPGLYVSEEMSGNQFKIAGGAPNGKVSWQVTGIRHDPYANAHRIPVEQDKPSNQRGTYLFPEGYGGSFRRMAGQSGTNLPPRDATPPKKATEKK